MKATLEFDLPLESEEFENSVNGPSYKISIQDILNYFRTQVKYKECTEEKYKLYEKIKEDIIEILEENEVLNKI